MPNCSRSHPKRRLMKVDSPPRERPGFGAHDHPYPYSAFAHIRDTNVRKFVEASL